MNRFCSLWELWRSKLCPILRKDRSPKLSLWASFPICERWRKSASGRLIMLTDRTSLRFLLDQRPEAGFLCRDVLSGIFAEQWWFPTLGFLYSECDEVEKHFSICLPEQIKSVCIPRTQHVTVRKPGCVSHLNALTNFSSTWSGLFNGRPRSSAFRRTQGVLQSSLTFGHFCCRRDSFLGLLFPVQTHYCQVCQVLSRRWAKEGQSSFNSPEDFSFLIGSPWFAVGQP